MNGEYVWFKNGADVNDRKYSDEIKNGKPNVQGTITYFYGFEYHGNYIDEKIKNRWKTFKFPDGRIFAGEFNDGKRNGQGIITMTDGGKFLGKWKEDNPWNLTQQNNNGNILRKIVNGMTLD